MNKPKGLFDHVEAIYTNQRIDYFDNLSDGDKKSYNNYMVNRFLSMNVHQAPFVNELQKYTGALINESGEDKENIFFKLPPLLR